MAIIFVDGFDHLTVAQSLRKWDNSTGSLVTGVECKLVIQVPSNR